MPRTRQVSGTVVLASSPIPKTLLKMCHLLQGKAARFDSIPKPVDYSIGCKPTGRAWIMMRSATDSSKADLHVFSKLFDDGLERGQEAKAFSWRQIGGHDDVLDFFVGHLINVEMTRQPAP